MATNNALNNRSTSGFSVTGGALALPTTTSTAGQITINSNRAFHSYGTASIFVGENAGNFTTSLTNTVGIGYEALNAQGTDNTVAIGYRALKAVQGSFGTSNNNVAIGAQAGSQVTFSVFQNVFIGAEVFTDVGISVSDNVMIGYQAGPAARTNPAFSMRRNVYIGTRAGRTLDNDSAQNIIIGYEAGSGLTYGVNNILIGAAGSGFQTNSLIIGTDGLGAYPLTSATINGIYGVTGGSTTASIPVIDSNSQIVTGTPDSTTISLSDDATSTTANLFTGAAVKTVTLGSTNTTSTTTITSGTGGVQIGSFINLPTTTSSVGQIKSNGTTIVNAYQSSIYNTDIFIGQRSGNYTASSLYGANTSIGADCLNGLTSGYGNVGIGSSAARAVSSGLSNLAIGTDSLRNLTTGSGNVAIGDGAGKNYNGGESSNIIINNNGFATGSNRLTIGSGTGTGYQQLNEAFINGIRGITTGINDAIAVLIDSAGQLGTVSSSIRYKENVSDMGDVSSRILELRPVTFDFIGKPNHKKQLGLIAEEVKEIMPELVVHNQDGEVESVKYHELPILLLNELQKLKKEVQELKAQLK